MRTQQELFDRAGGLPPGLLYRAAFLAEADETALLLEIERLPFEAARYRTFTARRRIVSFGVGYDFATNAPLPAPPLPSFLQALRERAAAWSGIPAADLCQCTVAEYARGTPLGWHRDAPSFGAVVGVSLAAPARMRLRRWPHVTHASERALVLALAPRSAYVLRGEARWRWQHAISPTPARRYSITFRTMRRA